MGWHCLCGFLAFGLTVLLLLPHCSSCGGALGHRWGRRDEQGADHHVDGTFGVSTGSRGETGTDSYKSLHKGKVHAVSNNDED